MPKNTIIHFILERPQYTVSFVSSNLARPRFASYTHAGYTPPLSRRGYPVCLLYPWPWWQANKTPGPVLQDVDDSADFDSPSHYNYYNGTFNSTPSINDFISQRERLSRERYTSLSSVACILSVCACLSFSFHESSLHPSAGKRGECYFRERNFRVSMKGDGIYRAVWFILWTNVHEMSRCRARVFVTGMAASNSGFCGVRAMPRR